MTDKELEQVQGRVTKLINHHYRYNGFREDMVQEAMIEVTQGANIYLAIAKARRAERSWNKAKRLYGEQTLTNLDARAIEAVDNQHEIRERREVCRDALLYLVHLPIATFKQITGYSLRWCNKLKQDIRDTLELPQSVGKRA